MATSLSVNSKSSGLVFLVPIKSLLADTQQTKHNIFNYKKENIY